MTRRGDSLDSARSPRALEDQPVISRQTAEEAYPGYDISAIRAGVSLLTTIFLFLLWAFNPRKSLAIIAVGTEYIGAMKKCSGNTCGGWYEGGGASTTPIVEQAPAGTTPSPAATITKRAGSLPDPSTFFLTTGTAILAAFYISLFITLCFIIRFFSPPDPPPMDKTTQEEQEEVSTWNNCQVFAYRASRSMGVVLVILTFGCLIASGMAVQSARTEMKLQGSNGIGGGLFLLLLSLLFSFYSCLRDLASPDGWVRRWLGLHCCCPSMTCCGFRKQPPEQQAEEALEMVERSTGQRPLRRNREEVNRPDSGRDRREARSPVSGLTRPTEVKGRLRHVEVTRGRGERI